MTHPAANVHRVILSDRSIREEIANGRIVIDPLVESAIQPSSIDVHLDRSFRVFLNHTRTVIDVKEDLRDLTQLVEIDDDGAFILHPGEFVLGSTRERIALPDDLVSRIEGKSSLARLGLLIHSSLPGSEPVMVLQGGRLTPMAIEDVVRKQLPGMVVAFDPDTFEVGYHPITGWYEGPADRIYEVQLASGRSVRVTAGHNLFSLDRNGQLVKVRTGSLQPGIRVAVPRRIPDPAEVDRTLRLTDHLPDAVPLELTVEGPSVAAAFAADGDMLASLLLAGGFASTAHYRRHARLPYVVARQLSGLVADLGEGDRFGLRGGRNSVPARIEVDRELAWLLGLYVAEGYRRAQQVVVSNTDQSILDRAAAALSVLGLTFHRSSGAITVGSSVLSAVLGWLGTGGKAPTKRVPPVVFGWPSDLVAAFLDGVVDGDGSNDGGRTSVWTTSSALMGDLLILFARLGRRAGNCARPPRGNAVRSWQVYAPDTEHKLLTSVPLPDGDLVWDEVVAVHDTGHSETIFDIEVRPNGRTIENFLAGTGGVFVSNTAGFIDPGFDGHITLELANVATLPITLYPGMKIGQISFMRMTTPADVPYGSSKLGSKYQGQRGPTPSRYFENFRDDEGG